MLNALETGFYNLLKGNASLATKLGAAGSDTKIYHLVAPQGSAQPYLVYGLLTNTSDDTFTKKGAIENSTFYINIFTKASPADLGTIADLLMAFVDNATLSVTGYSSLLCKREYIGQPLYDEDTRVYMQPIRYRILLGKN